MNPNGPNATEHDRQAEEAYRRNLAAAAAAKEREAKLWGRFYKHLDGAEQLIERVAQNPVAAHEPALLALHEASARAAVAQAIATWGIDS